MKWWGWKRTATIAAAIAVLAGISAAEGRGGGRADAATSSFRFVVLGDSRGSSDGINETTLRTLMQKIKGLSVQPSFVLFSGDQVQGGSDVQTELAEWSAIVDDYYPMTQIYPALGNHENDETIFSSAFSYLPSSQLSGYQRTAYYFDYSNTRFFVLNSNREDASGNYVIDSTQRSWLQSKLQSNGKTHNFIMLHVPAYPIGAHYGSSLDANKPQRDAFWDIAENNNVTAVMVGHEHNYNRRKIDSSFSANGYTFTNPIQQVTLGGAGAPLSSTVSDTKGIAAGPVANYHYMVVDIVDGLATFNVYDINGNPIDSFTENRVSGGGATPTPTPTATPTPTPTATPTSTPGSKSVSFQDGAAPSSSYSGTLDTYLYQNSPSTNYGTAAKLLVDGDEPTGTGNDSAVILQWGLGSSIPSGSIVTGASLTLNITDSSTSSYEIYEMKRAWTESGATWNSYASGSPWSTAGAGGSSDKGSSALGSVSASATGSVTLPLNAAGIALVQSWVNSSSSNHGLLIKNSSNTNGLDFSSSEATTLSTHPKLTILYK